MFWDADLKIIDCFKIFELSTISFAKLFRPYLDLFFIFKQGTSFVTKKKEANINEFPLVKITINDSENRCWNLIRWLIVQMHRNNRKKRKTGSRKLNNESQILSSSFPCDIGNFFGNSWNMNENDTYINKLWIIGSNPYFKLDTTHIYFTR